MAPDDPASRIVTRYLDGLNAHDPDAIAACVADDFVNEHTSALGSSCEGRETYRGRLPGFLTDFAGLRYDVVATVADGDDVAVRYRMTAGYDGHPIDMPGVMLFTIRNGLIARRADFWDSLTFLRQAGQAPVD